MDLTTQNEKIVNQMLQIATNGYGYSNTNSEEIAVSTVRNILREVTGEKEIRNIKSQ